MTDILGSLKETTGCPNRKNDRGLRTTEVCPNELVRRPRSPQTVAPLRASRRFHALGGSQARAEECWPQGQLVSDSTPIGRAYVSVAPRLNKPERPAGWACSIGIGVALTLGGQCFLPAPAFGRCERDLNGARNHPNVRSRV